MKAAIFIITLLAMSLIMTGCSTNDNVIQSQSGASEYADQPAIDPDIGTLDNITVSDSIPQ